MKVLVAVFSGLDMAKYSGRREMCRRSWFPGLYDLGYSPKFILSKPERPEDLPKDYREDDCVILDGIPETWSALPRKTLALHRWALQQSGWAHLAKFDDDSLVIPSRFDSFCRNDLKDLQYVGADVGTCQRMPPYASGGAGYILRFDSAWVASTELERHADGYEDKIVGDAMRAANIPFTSDKRFSPWPSFGIPAKDNDLISGHALNASQWWSAWESCTS